MRIFAIWTIFSLVSKMKYEHFFVSINSNKMLSQQMLLRNHVLVEGGNASDREGKLTS